ncbi:MAG: aminotransferase class V-fold PLP-dependent enzyme [Planctomycetota bacterium]|nr:aminotransferase class V-fold PLP-dependent enzyme [Planctomycetota bacterium]
MSRIYLDNAATSFPKPDSVHAAVDRFNRQVGVSLGRGAYRDAMDAQAVVTRCRKRAADLLGAESPDRIIFTFNGTDSLNLAIHGLLQPGDHVVTTVMEHNSVLRPLRDLRDRQQVEVSYAPADAEGRVAVDDVRAAMRDNTKLVAVTHASNVTGTIQPIEDIGEIAREAGAVFLVDAAQTAGHLPIDVSQLPADLVACAGHKGLLGPLGVGLLYIRPGIEARLRSIRQGGTGSKSEDDRQPESLPDKYESGNHNGPALFGLDAALQYLDERGIAAIQQHEEQLTGQLMDMLGKTRGIHVYGPAANQRVGVVSVAINGFEPQILAGILDENFEVQTRAGLHCAPGAHRAIGTFDQGGTVRLSVGPFTSTTDL